MERDPSAPDDVNASWKDPLRYKTQTGDHFGVREVSKLIKLIRRSRVSDTRTAAGVGNDVLCRAGGSRDSRLESCQTRSVSIRGYRLETKRFAFELVYLASRVRSLYESETILNDRMVFRKIFRDEKQSYMY